MAYDLVHIYIYMTNEKVYLCPQQKRKQMFTAAVFKQRKPPNVQQWEDIYSHNWGLYSYKNEQFTATHNINESHKIILSHRNHTPNTECMIPLT